MKTRNILAVALIASAGSAFATSELGIDVNSLTGVYDNGAGSGAGFGTGASGSVTFSHDLSSVLANVRIDGVSVGPTGGVTLASFSGVITLTSGGVTGGSMSITDSAGTTYSATVLGGVGSVTVQAGQGFSIDGITFAGGFSAPTFGGVGIGPWFFGSPVLPGTVLNIAFSPNAFTGVDEDTDIELTAVVPLPQAAGLGLAGLAGLGLRRRR